jgi:hypothetical protein
MIVNHVPQIDDAQVAVFKKVLDFGQCKVRVICQNTKPRFLLVIFLLFVALTSSAMISLLLSSLLLLKSHRMLMMSSLGTALDNFTAPMLRKKFPCRQEKPTHREGKKNNSHHSQNHLFLLSTMVANTHLGSLFCNIHIPSSQLEQRSGTRHLHAHATTLLKLGVPLGNPHK